MKIEEYRNLRGKSPFKIWFEGLDTQTALIIHTVLTRIKCGSNSNIKNVGGGVFERIIDKGPGYRIYFGKEAQDIILLCGGSKNGQQKDINMAKFLWKEYKQRKNTGENKWY